MIKRGTFASLQHLDKCKSEPGTEYMAAPSAMTACGLLDARLFKLMESAVDRREGDLNGMKRYWLRNEDDKGTEAR